MTVTEINGIVGFVFSLLLFVVFLTLKLTLVITWPWLWVFSPLWIPFGIGFLMMAFGYKPPQ
jgi:hypothetical protein